MQPPSLSLLNTSHTEAIKAVNLKKFKKPNGKGTQELRTTIFTPTQEGQNTEPKVLPSGWKGCTQEVLRCSNPQSAVQNLATAKFFAKRKTGQQYKFECTGNYQKRLSRFNVQVFSDV